MMARFAKALAELANDFDDLADAMGDCDLRDPDDWWRRGEPAPFLEEVSL